MTTDETTRTAPIAVKVDEAARLSGLSRSTLYRLMAQGQLASTVVRNRRLIVTASLRTLVTGDDGEHTTNGGNDDGPTAHGRRARRRPAQAAR